MSQLLKYRQKLNLTQDELAEKSGISIRTIQRIEAGTEPKGYTLKTLANTLGITPDELLGWVPVEQALNYSLIKRINLSSLPFAIFPPFNIVVPVMLMYRKKMVNSLTKDIVSLQILWTIIAAIIFLFSAFMNRIFSMDFPFTVIAWALLSIIDIYIIIRNTVAIDKNQALRIRLNFSFL